MAVTARGMPFLLKSRVAAAVVIMAAYLFFLLGFLNNHGAYLQEGYLESVRIPKAIKSFYPKIPEKYGLIFLSKRAGRYGGESRIDKLRTISTAGFYAPLALQYWYPDDREICAEWYPSAETRGLRPEGLYIVYDYEKDAMLFNEVGAEGVLVPVGKVEMSGSAR